MVRPAGLAVAGMILTVCGVLVVDVAGAAAFDPSDADAIPEHVAEVYDYAAATAPCPVPFSVVAGIGAVTSDHTRVGGDSRLLSDGASEPTIVYEQLAPTAPSGRLPDTDAGAIDGVADADITVGPMQFLPATWVQFGVDGNGDGTTDPNNLWDAAASAANRLCAASVDTDLEGALTAYFGTEDYNDWVIESIDAAAAWQLAQRPAPERRELDVVGLAITPTEATVDGGASAEPVGGLAGDDAAGGDTAGEDTAGGVTADDSAAGVDVAGVEQVPGSQPAPVLIGPPAPSATGQLVTAARGDTTVSGDWNGDGTPDEATLEVGGQRAMVRRIDALGRPYGRAIDVSAALSAPGAVGGLVVGEWDGDGIDDLALLVADADGVVVTRFDRGGNVIDTADLGPLGPDDEIVVGPAPVAALTLGDEAPWKGVTAFDGTELDLWKVGGIVVEQSMVEQTSAMLAAAAADGVSLDGWGWRSHEAQIELRRAHCADIWTTPASACSPPTAIPGTSRHEFGTAIDFHVDTVAIGRDSVQFRWLAENAERFGYFNLPSEPWHWSTDGG
ncbi:MAG: D-alanyl-D-alanine carboxypeptidase family protein [Acidimicrobiales bacterium]